MLIKKHLGLLGFKAVDKVIGFKGVIDSVCFDLYGCIQASIRPSINKEGNIPDGRWFDITRLDLTSKKPVMKIPNYEWGIHAEGNQGPTEKTNRSERLS